jgi:hypothetical protein
VPDLRQGDVDDGDVQLDDDKGEAASEQDGQGGSVRGFHGFTIEVFDYLKK